MTETDLLFYSPLFLYLFLPTALIAYLAVRGGWRDFVFLAWSAGFYFWGEPRFVPWVIASALADYVVCGRMHATQGTPAARHYLALGVTLNLLLLCYFKYLNLAIEATDSLLLAMGFGTFALPNVALPIGVSFIVFEKISYLADVYGGRAAPAATLRSYLLYVLMFPKLLAGPIIKYHDIEAQLREHRVNLDDLFEGFRRFLLGLTKKLLIADTVGEIADQVFGLPASELGFATAWLGVACFTVQIYFDFSGYSDMAIGLARMFGFRLMENFNLPYVATSFTDFWRRWHISLSSWIREYLYWPLGGNRNGFARTCANLWICFLLSGLWHGAHWTFVLWGAYHGSFLILDKLFWEDFSRRLPQPVNIALTLFLVMIGWVIFRSGSMAQMSAMLGAMFDPGRPGTAPYVTVNVWAALWVGAGLAVLPAFDGPRGWLPELRLRPGIQIAANWGICCFAMFALAKGITATFNPFLYFRF